jgi:hypothetical protein
MRFAATGSQFNKFAPRESFPQAFTKARSLGFFRAGRILMIHSFRLGISVFGIDILVGLNHSFIDILQTVRFLANTFDQVNLDVSPLQQSDCLPLARLPRGVSTFCFWVKFVLGHHVAICFDPSVLSGPAVTVRCDLERLFGVLVNPFLSEPFPWVGIVGCKQVEALGADAHRMPKWDYVSG